MTNPILNANLNPSYNASTTQIKNTNPARTRIGEKMIHRLMNGNIHLIANRIITPIIAIPYPILEIIANFFYSKVDGNFTF